MSALFNQLNSIDEIYKYQESLSSKDKEGVSFEAKGDSGDSFGNKTKKKLAKEICAFANTYGGVLWYGKSGVDQKERLTSLDDSETSKIKKSIETWLRDSLEPRLMGIDLKEVEGTFLINIPQSSTRPHRASTDRDYYYRNVTQSVPMPEIMISSMYRAGDLLSIETSLSFSKQSNQGTLYLLIKNNSKVAGTRPNCRIAIFGHKNPNCLMTWKADPFTVGGSCTDWKISNLFLLGVFSADEVFANKVLYPADKFSQFISLKPNLMVKADAIAKVWENEVLMISTVTNFLETTSHESYEVWALNSEKYELIVRTNEFSIALFSYQAEVKKLRS